MTWHPIKHFPGYQISKDRQRIRKTVFTKQATLTSDPSRQIEKTTERCFTNYKYLTIHQAENGKKYAWLWQHATMSKHQFWLDLDDEKIDKIYDPKNNYNNCKHDGNNVRNCNNVSNYSHGKNAKNADNEIFCSTPPQNPISSNITNGCDIGSGSLSTTFSPKRQSNLTPFVMLDRGHYQQLSSKNGPNITKKRGVD